MTFNDLCGPCREAWFAWSDYKMPPAPIRLISIGAGSVREVLELRRMRADDHYALIRRQQAGIMEICRTKHKETKK